MRSALARSSRTVTVVRRRRSPKPLPTSDVGRIVYLGGLFPDGEALSTHLSSRKEVGDILVASGVPTTVLRAAVILGSGSASFEMLRYLTERLPVMVTPKWLDNRIQPIAVRDVLHYLVGSATMPAEVSRAFDIGGPDVLTYREMMQGYARVAGLPKRRIQTVPLLTPSLSSHWVGLVTPVPNAIARPLVDSLVHEVVCKEHDIDEYVAPPADGLTGFDRAVELALARIRDLDVDHLLVQRSHPGAPSDPLPERPRLVRRLACSSTSGSAVVQATPEQLWDVIEGIGGDTGWYSWGLGWTVRGALDKLVGGPGLRRGPAQPAAPGRSATRWTSGGSRSVEPPRLLRLRAEMRLPGLAWLELSTDTDEDGATVFRQRALFHPQGLLGHVYWWS